MNHGTEDENSSAQQMKADFVKKLGQELYTPVNEVIAKAAQLLGSSLDADQKEAAQTIQYRSESLLVYLNDTIELAKMDAGEMRMAAVDFNLRDIIEDTVGAFSEQATVKALEMASLFYQDVPRQLRGDAEKLQQVLAYILGNVIGYSEQGEMVVRVRRKSETGTSAILHFSVKDSSLSVTKGEQQNFFHALGDSDGGRGFNPAGLRVAIVRKLVEMLGGEIGVESVQGKGSTVWFTALFDKQGTRGIPKPTVSKATFAPSFGNGLAAPAAVPAPAASIAPIAPVASAPAMEAAAVPAQNEISNGNGAPAYAPPATPTPEPANAPEAAIEESDASHEEPVREIPKFEEHSSPVVPTVAAEEPVKAEAKEFAVPAMENEVPPVMVVPRFRKDQASENEPAPVFQNRASTDENADTIGGQGNFVPPIPKPPLLKLIMSKFPGNGAGNGGNGKSHSKRRILVAEDNATNQRVILMKLQKMGYEAEVVSNGAEVLDAVSRASYDLVLMDCTMPEMDGYEAALQIRTREGGNGKRVPIIAMAANSGEGDRDKCTASGMDDTISKTAGPEDLQRVLGNWLPA